MLGELAAGLGGRPRDIATAILEGQPRPIALGRLATATGARRFAMMAGIGFDARVVSRVDPGLKR
jgi:diacylglycerol kinase family enzyme